LALTEASLLSMGTDAHPEISAVAITTMAANLFFISVFPLLVF
jgi:hypothetical protein